MFPGSFVLQVYMAHNVNMTKGPIFYVPMFCSSRVGVTLRVT